MAAITIFRGLTITALAVFAAEIATGVMAFFGPDVPAAVQSYLAAKNTGTLANVFTEANLGTQIAVGILLLLYLVAFIASLIGLLGFRRWARWLFIIVTSLTLIFLASGGMTLSTPLESLASALGFMADGAIVTLLFIEPIRERFRREPATPSTPAGPVDPLDPTEP